jgi:pSer/pThr/pTyr-binding forkhead associated (FHA) protein
MAVSMLTFRRADPPTAVLAPPRADAGACLSLGRDPYCDFVVADPTVSARHAELLRTLDGWMIRDLGSRNGTRVNGWLTSSAELEPGDAVTLGAVRMRFTPRD